jgi:hypothetical protein
MQTVSKEMYERDLLYCTKINLMNLEYIYILLISANVVPISPIFVNLMMEVKHRFLQEPHKVTSQKTAFFIVTAVKTSKLISLAISPQVNYTDQAAASCPRI